MLHPMPYRFYQPPNKALQQTQPSVHVATEPTTEGIFFDIVEARTRDHRPLLVTTNHSGAAMEKLFSENIAAPLVRRLRDHCDCFAFEQGK